MKLNKSLSSAGPQDTIISLGSRMLDMDYGHLEKAQRVLIFEPDPARASFLRQRFGRHSNLRISATAVSERTGKAVLGRFNYEALNGFVHIHTLQQRFPGVRQTETMTIPTLEANALTAKLPEKHRGRDILIVDMLGQESDVLEALAAAGILDRISDIFLRTMSDSLVDNDIEEIPVRSRLKQHGFDKILDLEREEEPDFPIFLALRYPQLRRMDALSKQVQHQETERKMLIEDLKKCRDAGQKTQQTLQAARQDLSVALRLQAVRESDLKDLQDRFSVLLKRSGDRQGRLGEPGDAEPTEPKSPAPSPSRQSRSAPSVADSETRPPIRTVHNPACSGGTLISRCIAAMPNTEILSEVEPLSTLRELGRFVPSDLISLARCGSRSHNDELLAEVFLAGLEPLYQDAEKRGVSLILRDHAHSIFFDGPTVHSRPHLRAILQGAYPLLSIVVLRHPLAAFSSLAVNDWLHFGPATLEAYAQRYLAFLDSHEGIEQIRYEDLLADSETEMQRICEILQLRYSPDFHDTFSAFSLSGASGRKGNIIKSRPPRPISKDLAVETENSPCYIALCKRLGYPMILEGTEIQAS